MNFFNKNEIMIFFNLDKLEFDDLIKNGMPHYKIGNSIRFSVNEVSSFLEKKNSSIVGSEFNDYLKKNNLSFNDFWDESSILKAFNISIENLALACYNGFNYLSFDNKKYFKKDNFLNFIKISSTIKEEPKIKTMHLDNPLNQIEKLSLSDVKEPIVKKNATPNTKLHNVDNIVFPCLITDASLSMDIDEYRGGITVLESKTQQSHFSFRGQVTSGISTIAELFVIVRALRFFKKENIDKGTLLTDQKSFIHFWDTDSKKYLNKNKLPSHFHGVLDEVCELKNILKNKINVFYIGDNSKNLYDSLFFKSYKNSHRICQVNVLSSNFEDCSFDLSKYNYKEDFISLKELTTDTDLTNTENNSTIENFSCDFLIRLLPSSNDVVPRTEAMNFNNNRKNLCKLTSSPSKLHALLISTTNISKSNPDSKVFVFLTKKLQKELNTLLKKHPKLINRTEFVTIKHYKNLVKNPNIQFIDSVLFDDLKKSFEAKKEVV